MNLKPFLNDNLRRRLLAIDTVRFMSFSLEFILEWFESIFSELCGTCLLFWIHLYLRHLRVLPVLPRSFVPFVANGCALAKKCTYLPSTADYANVVLQQVKCSNSVPNTYTQKGTTKLVTLYRLVALHRISNHLIFGNILSLYHKRRRNAIFCSFVIFM